MAVLKSLTFTTLPATGTNPTVDRRARVVARIEERKLILKDRNYTRIVRNWVKKDGERVMVEKRQRVPLWWRTHPNGSYGLTAPGGRGLPLSVNQHGERMDNPAMVHEINVLTVVAREGHKDFVSGLQKQISETLSARRFGFDAVLIEAGCRAIDMAGSLDVALWRDGSVL